MNFSKSYGKRPEAMIFIHNEIFIIYFKYLI